MNRPALVAASIFLLGCGTPFQLLIHNDLSQNAQFTAHWKEREGSRDDEVSVPQGRADYVTLGWGGPPDKLDVEWRTEDGRYGKIVGRVVPKGAYHAYVDERTVRFEAKDWKDALNENFLWLTPVWWSCGLFVLLPTAVVWTVRRPRRTS